MVQLACERHLRDLETGQERGLVFDEAAADRVIQFFGFLKQRKGRWAQQPIALSESQIFRIGSVFGWKRADGTRRFRVAYNDFPRKYGKALALDTPIPTPTGWIAMGDLHEGDLVFNERGQPSRVTFATDPMLGHDCYRVRFSDGTSIVADAEHLWYTEARRTGLPHTGNGPKSTWEARHIRTTAQIRETLNLSETRVEWNHRVPLALPLETSEAVLPIPPYVLGAWLGDGHSASARLTIHDADCQILGECEREGVEVRPGAPNASRTATYSLGSSGRTREGRTHSLGLALKRAGLLNNKHIPAAYLRASHDQRLALLQGLMDTDGSAYSSQSGTTACEFATTSAALRDGVMELLRSLGFKPSCAAKRAMLAGKDHGEAYRVTFTAFADQRPFRLERKLARLRARPATSPRSQFRQIVGVDPVESVPVRCIAVDTPSHLFLAGEGMVPTHNTTEAAGIGNYLAFFDGEPGAEVYATATKKDQARICWSEAKWQMSNAPAALRNVLDIRVANMNRPDNSSKFEAIGADEDSTDGLNPNGMVLDELHAWKSEEFLGKLETAGGARTQPLRWVITTPGTQTSTLYLRERAYAESVLRGTYDDDSWFVFISCIDEPDRWDDEEQWELAYAGHLGRTVTIDFLRDEYKRAAVSPAKQSMFKRMYLGLITSSADAWLTPATWDAQAESIGVETGARATVGVDLASIRDIAAVIWWFPDEDGDGGDLVAKLYMPKDGVVKRVQEDGVPYDTWAEQGWITLTPGSTIDYDFIEADFKEMAETYQVRTLGIDPWQAVQFRTHLEGDGFTVVKIPQNAIRLNAVVDEAERLLSIGRVRCANPVMRWMALNAVTVTDSLGNRKLDKTRSAEKIDGIAAWLNALHEAMAMAPAEETSVYEERGIISF